MRTVGNLVSIFIQVSIWRAVLGNQSANGINLQDMVTYVILNALLTTLLMDQIFQNVDERLRTGNIALDLIKPYRYPFYLAFEQLGNACFQFIFTVVPTFIFAILFFGFHAPSSILDGLAFLVTVFFALSISFAIGYLIALLAFWFLATFHFEWTLAGLMTVFSGSFLPIWFFSPTWATVAHILPFQFLGFIPASMYMGRISAADVLPTLGLGLLWTLILLGLAWMLWQRAMSRLVIQGG